MREVFSYDRLCQRFPERPFSWEAFIDQIRLQKFWYTELQQTLSASEDQLLTVLKGRHVPRLAFEVLDSTDYQGVDFKDAMFPAVFLPDGTFLKSFGLEASLCLARMIKQPTLWSELLRGVEPFSQLVFNYTSVVDLLKSALAESMLLPWKSVPQALQIAAWTGSELPVPKGFLPNGTKVTLIFEAHARELDEGGELCEYTPRHFWKEFSDTHILEYRPTYDGRIVIAFDLNGIPQLNISCSLEPDGLIVKQIQGITPRVYEKANRDSPLVNVPNAIRRQITPKLTMLPDWEQSSLYFAGVVAHALGLGDVRAGLHNERRILR